MKVLVPTDFSATIARNLNFAKSYLRNAGINTQAIDVGHDLSFDEPSWNTRPHTNTISSPR